MRFSTFFAATATLAAAVTGMAIEERDVVISDEITLGLLRAYQEFDGDENLQKRGCGFDNCQLCYDRYPYCHMNNFPSTINCLARCSKCPGKC